MAKKTILVTGGLGYIGSHTIVELLSNNTQVICLDNLSNSKVEVIDSIKEITNKDFDYHNVDITSMSLLQECLGKYSQIDGIIHFSAFKAVGESVQEPIKYYENNIVSLLNIIKIADQYSANIVFSSSCTVYGESDELPITEDAKIVAPKSPYGNTKKICEEILNDFSKVFNNKITCLRYFNPVGAHASGKLGEIPIGIPQNLLPYLTQTAIGKRAELTIFGNDYATSDGTCIRDFIHVCDVAQAHLAAIDYMLNHDALSYSVFNIGRGEGTSILQLVNRFIQLTNVDFKFVFGPRREGDIVESWATCSKANKELHWKARYTLDDIINTAWKWENTLNESKISL